MAVDTTIETTGAVSQTTQTALGGAKGLPPGGGGPNAGNLFASDFVGPLPGSGGPDATITTGGSVQQRAQGMPAQGGARNLPPGGGGPNAGDLGAPGVFSVPTWAWYVGGGLIALAALAAAAAGMKK